MVTGASTANLSIVLVDARLGVIEQSRRHTCIAALLRIPHLVIAVNKMDLVGLERGALHRNPRPVRGVPAAPGRQGRPVHPAERAQRRQRRRALASTPRGIPARRCWATWKASTSAATGTSTASACPCSGSTARTTRPTRSCTTSAASAARSPAASCASARKSWCCPAAWSAP